MSVLGGGGFDVGATPSRNRPHSNLGVLRLAVFALFGILIGQLAYMQLWNGDEYARRSRDNHIIEKNTLPTRGLIYDRNGEPLVQNVGVYTATILPELLPESPDERYRLYLQLERLVGVPALEVQAKVKQAEDDKRGYIEIPVQKYLTKAQALRLGEASTDMPGVSLSVKPGRNYPAGPEFSHLLGYIGDQTQEEHDVLREDGYALNEPVGKDGIESRYEKDLRGTLGVIAAEQDALGHLIEALKTTDPIPGNGVRLAIDAGLQRYVAELLQDSMAGDQVNGDATTAAAVVMSPRTGEVYAIVSIPAYDNNIFNEPDKRGDEYDALLQDTRHPFLNQALWASAPGSVFKLVTAAAALETGRITPETGRDVTSKELDVKGENGQLYPLYDWRIHGYVNLYSAISWSSNIYFYQASCGILGENKGLGKDAESSAVILGYYARALGFGSPTGIDIGGEADGGIIPDPAWKARVHAPDNPEDREWYYADTCFMGIGQGDVLATPLQVARMTAAVANGGKLLTPHVAKEIVSPDGKVIRAITPVAKQVPVSAANFAAIREGMHQSVGYGSPGGAGARAQVPGLDIAGKTGTAEFFKADGSKAQHAWFTGFMPFNDPEVVVTVYFDLGVGGDKAAPIAGKILKYFNDNVKP
jgi:penicillin-binding protein 2